MARAGNTNEQSGKIWTSILNTSSPSGAKLDWERERSISWTIKEIRARSLSAIQCNKSGARWPKFCPSTNFPERDKTLELLRCCISRPVWESSRPVPFSPHFKSPFFSSARNLCWRGRRQTRLWRSSWRDGDRRETEIQGGRERIGRNYSPSSGRRKLTRRSTRYDHLPFHS